MKIMKRKKKQILQLSDEEDDEEKGEEKETNNKKEDDSNVNKIKKEIQNIDGFLTRFGNCTNRFLPMLYWKKELEMLLRLLKVLVKAVVDAYPHDGKKNNILFCFVQC